MAGAPCGRGPSAKPIPSQGHRSLAHGISDRREGSGHSRPYPLPFPARDSLIITTNILHTALGLVRYRIINVSLPTLVSIQPSRASRRYRSPPTPEHAHHEECDNARDNPCHHERGTECAPEALPWHDCSIHRLARRDSHTPGESYRPRLPPIARHEECDNARDNPCHHDTRAQCAPEAPPWHDCSLHHSAGKDSHAEGESHS